MSTSSNLCSPADDDDDADDGGDNDDADNDVNLGAAREAPTGERGPYLQQLSLFLPALTLYSPFKLLE